MTLKKPMTLKKLAVPASAITLSASSFAQTVSANVSATVTAGASVDLGSVIGTAVAF